jgi:predicted O-linked N-acetylglucosamine transferase (SPINDLY family)
MVLRLGCQRCDAITWILASDAVIYLSAQRGYKYHPDTARLQMQIIKEVPNSYFLIKGLADQESSKSFLSKLPNQREWEPIACDF